MSKYSLNAQKLSNRPLITSRDYPTLSSTIVKRAGRIHDTGINFVVHFADGSKPIPCRKLKDALLYVNLVSFDKMPQSYRNLFQ